MFPQKHFTFHDEDQIITIPEYTTNIFKVFIHLNVYSSSDQLEFSITK